MDLEQRASLLAATEPFHGTDRAVLRELASRAVLRTYRKGQFIFNQGDEPTFVVVITSGAVQLVSTSEQGGQLIFDVIRPPYCFGLVAVIDGEPRSVSAEVITPTVALVVAREPLLEAVRVAPSLAESMLGFLAGRLRATEEQVRDFAFRDLAGRVAKRLVGLAGPDAPPGTVIGLQQPRLTQSDLADAVGGSRQSVNQALRGFQARGWIEVDAGRIKLLRPDLLRQRAGL